MLRRCIVLARRPTAPAADALMAKGDRHRATAFGRSGDAIAEKDVPYYTTPAAKGGKKFRPPVRQPRGFAPMTEDERTRVAASHNANAAGRPTMSPADLALQEENERRRRIPAMAEQEAGICAVERVNPDFSRIWACDNVHFTDEVTHALLPGGPGGEPIAVYHSDLTVAEQAVLDGHQAWIRGLVDGAPTDDALPELPPGITLEEAGRRLSAVPASTATFMLDFASSVDKTPIRYADVTERALLPEAGELSADSPAYAFVLYVENGSLRTVSEMLRERFGIHRSLLRTLKFEHRSPSVATTLAIIPAAVGAGRLLSVNTMRLPVGLARVSNVHRVSWGTATELMHGFTAQPHRSEVTRLIRRCGDNAPLVKAALTHVKTNGALGFLGIGPPTDREARVFTLMTLNKSAKAFIELIDTEIATAPMIEFVKRFNREAAHAYSAKVGRRHDTASKLIAVYGASGSTTAALCSLPTALRRRIRLAPSLVAFNAMLSRRHRMHGRRVVAGDLVVRKDVTVGAGKWAHRADICRVETAADAAQYTIDDVVLPLLDPTRLQPEVDLPACDGLHGAQLEEMLRALGLAYLLPGGLANVRDFIHVEFDFTMDGDDPQGIVFSRVAAKPEIDFRVFEHDAPSNSGAVFDARLVLPHDRALAATGFRPSAAQAAITGAEPEAEATAVSEEGSEPSSSFAPAFPFRAFGDERFSSSSSTTTADDDVHMVRTDAAYETLGVHAASDMAGGADVTMNPSRAFHKGRSGTDQSWRADESPGYGADDFIDVPSDGAPEYLAPVGSADAMDSARVTTVALVARAAPRELYALLREVFVLHRPVDGPDIALQTNIHVTATHADGALDLSVAPEYCKLCYALQHKGNACPSARALQKAATHAYEHGRARAAKRALEASTVVKITRGDSSEAWGLKLHTDGEVLGVAAASPAHHAMEAALPKALPKRAALALLPEGDRPATSGDAAVARIGVRELGLESVQESIASGENTFEFKAGDVVKPYANRRFKVVAVNGAPTKDAQDVVREISALGKVTTVEISMKRLKARTLAN